MKLFYKYVLCMKNIYKKVRFYKYVNFFKKYMNKPICFTNLKQSRFYCDKSWYNEISLVDSGAIFHNKEIYLVKPPTKIKISSIEYGEQYHLKIKDKNSNEKILKVSCDKISPRDIEKINNCLESKENILDVQTIDYSLEKNIKSINFISVPREYDNFINIFLAGYKINRHVKLNINVIKEIQKKSFVIVKEDIPGPAVKTYYFTGEYRLEEMINFYNLTPNKNSVISKPMIKVSQ